MVGVSTPDGPVGESSVKLISLHEIEAAADRIRAYVAVTPLGVLTNGLRIKAESMNPVGSFKLRGAFNSILSLLPDERRRGVVTHSSGNHAQAVAYAAHRLGVPALIVMPPDAPISKFDGTRRWGAEIVECGGGSAALRDRAVVLAEVKGLTLIPPYDARPIIAATGTIAMELLASVPDLERVTLPLSGGGLGAGVAAGLKLLQSSVQIVGVEPELAADAYESFKAGRLVSLAADQMARTCADGLRVQQLGQLNWPHIRQYVDKIVTVSEGEIRSSIRQIATEARLVAEPSGAVAVAGALTLDRDLTRTVAIMSGGNVDLSVLAEILIGASDD